MPKLALCFDQTGFVDIGKNDMGAPLGAKAGMAAVATANVQQPPYARAPGDLLLDKTVAKEFVTEI